MIEDTKPIDLPKLRQLITIGIKCIPEDIQNNQAVMVIGDTGVGKSTIMSFLSGSDLVVKYDGLKPTLDNVSESNIHIGHGKLSDTTIPTKVVIDQMAFYDCPGFRDNKGEEYQISNSFFVQRLLNIYKRVKIVLIVDESHISEARADKLPKLLRNLHQAFERLDDIQDGVVMIINKAAREHAQENYHRQILKMIQLKKDHTYLFESQEGDFLKYLIQKKRIVLFRQAVMDEKDRLFHGSFKENNIMNTIKSCNFVKSKRIKNILSEAAKLSIREFIDNITLKSNGKIEIICKFLIGEYVKKVQMLGRNVDDIISLKEDIMKLNEELKSAKKQNIVRILQREIPKDKIQDFEQDFESVLFFKDIYDKTATYFSNLINKISAELSYLFNKLDVRITTIQKENQQELQKQREQQEYKIIISKRQQEKKVAFEHSSKMEQLKAITLTLARQKNNMMEQIQHGIRNLTLVEEQLNKIKKDTNNLKNISKQMDSQFIKVDQVQFSKKIS